MTRWLGRTLTVLVCLQLSTEGADAQIQHLPRSEDLVTTRMVREACRRVDLTAEMRGFRDENLEEIPEMLPDRDFALDASTVDDAVRTWSDLEPFCAASLSDMRGMVDHPIPSADRIRQAATADSTALIDLVSAWNANLLSVGGAAAGSVLGLDESVILEGFTQFLVDRASLELKLAFIDRIKGQICKDPYGPIFVQTCATLGAQDFTIHSSVLRELRDAVEKDLRRLPGTVPVVVVRSAAFAELSAPRRDVVLSAYFAGSVLVAVLDGMSAPEALVHVIEPDSIGGVVPVAPVLRESLARADADTTTNLPATALLYRVGLAAKALPDADGDGIPELPGPEQRDPYFRALAVNLDEWLPELGVTSFDVRRVLRLARDVTVALERIDTQAAAVASAGTDAEARLVAYAVLVDETLGMVEAWVAALEPVVRGASPPSPVAPYVAGIRQVSRNIAARDYASATTGLFTLAARLKGDSLEVPTNLLRFVSFAGALAQADSADQVAQVFEDFAAPVGSYLGKRTAEGGYVTFNAYLGAQFSWERSAVGGTTGSANGEAAGISAPVGPEVGFSVKGWSLGLMLQLIDVGALASYRIGANGDGLEPASKRGFAQVFAPGLVGVVGLPKLPLSLGLGHGYAPELRQHTDGMTPDETIRRTTLFLAVDVPVFRFR